MDIAARRQLLRSPVPFQKHPPKPPELPRSPSISFSGQVGRWKIVLSDMLR